MFDLIEGTAVDSRPAVVDAAELLRHFNAAGGVVHTMADELATTAVRTAATLTRAAIADRFTTPPDEPLGSSSVVEDRP